MKKLLGKVSSKTGVKISFSWKTKGIRIATEFNIFSFHLIDLKNIWKRKGVNYKIDFITITEGRKYWFHYWTPTWHEGKGPYITIGIRGLRIMRGY